MAGLVPAICVSRLLRQNRRPPKERAHVVGESDEDDPLRHRSSRARALPDRCRAVAGLPQPAGEAGRAVPRRRRHRCAGALVRQGAGGEARPAVRGREPRRLRHHPRRRFRRARGARRLHHHARHQLDLCDRAQRLQEGAVRYRKGFCADRAGRGGAVRPGGESGAAGEVGGGAGGIGAREARRDELRLGRDRHPASRQCGAAQDAHRHRDDARAVSRRRTGAAGRDRRSCADLFRRRQHRHAARARRAR